MQTEFPPDVARLGCHREATVEKRVEIGDNYGQAPREIRVGAGGATGLLVDPISSASSATVEDVGGAAYTSV